MVFVFARGEPGIGLLKLQGGSSVRHLGDRCRVLIIDGGDHIFSQSDHRSTMEEVLTAELLAPESRRIVRDLKPLNSKS